jgi:putative hydrolase
MKEAAGKLASGLPDVLRWLRNSLQGRSAGMSPIIDLLPDAQRETFLTLHSLLTVLEGHATHVTDLIGRRLLPDYDRMQNRIKASRRRPPLLRLLESLIGLEMKRQQYVVGRSFCEGVWRQGGSAALAPVWESPDNIPKPDELRQPQTWTARMRAA